jgi:hypothetical protein
MARRDFEYGFTAKIVGRGAIGPHVLTNGQGDIESGAAVILGR